MKVGTKSVLFGAHQFAIHPWFVAAAWWKLYGFPADPRLWVAFFVHDIGYFGKPNMDGTEGEQHPHTGAWIMGRLFGREWHNFCLYHSRYVAKKDGAMPSKLCFADKLAICITPAWLYLPLANLSGEIREYMKDARDLHYRRNNPEYNDQRIWYANMQKYVRSWLETHKNGAVDTWTPESRQGMDKYGVWK